jgi:hypothetical protein
MNMDLNLFDNWIWFQGFKVGDTLTVNHHLSYDTVTITKQLQVGGDHLEGEYVTRPGDTFKIFPCDIIRKEAKRNCTKNKFNGFYKEDFGSIEGKSPQRVSEYTLNTTKQRLESFLISNRYDDIDYIDMEVAANSIKSPVTGKYYTNVRSDAFAYGIQVLKNEGMIEVTNGFIVLSGFQWHHEFLLLDANNMNVDDADANDDTDSTIIDIVDEDGYDDDDSYLQF